MSESKERGTLLKKNWKLIVVVIAVAFFVHSNHGVVKDIMSLPRPKPQWIAAAGLMFTFSYFMQAWGWHLILRGLGQSPSARLSMRMWYMSLIARWMPGRVWYSASRLLLAKENGLSVAAVSFAMVMELVYILVAGMIVTVGFAGGIVKGLFSSSGSIAAVAVVAGVIFLCGALIVKPENLLSLCKVSLFRKLIKKIAGEELDPASMPTMSVTTSLKLLGFFTLYWLFSGVMFGVLAAAFLPMTPHRWLACMPTWPGSWLAGFFSILTPAGLGVREAVMWLMLKGSMSQYQAGVLAVSSRIMMVGVELLSAGVATLILKPTATTTVLDAPVEPTNEPVIDESMNSILPEEEAPSQPAPPTVTVPRVLDAEERKSILRAGHALYREKLPDPERS